MLDTELLVPNYPFVKKSDGETTVEQSLADLAYAQISARAPRLLKYAVAFQLLDQNRDRTKAVGLFGFKIGNKWIRVPIFYNKNDIGGTDLLMPTPDSFVPLTDRWVNLLVDGNQGAAGKPIDREESHRLSPSLWQLRTPPTKWASEIASPRTMQFLAKVKFGKIFEENEKEASNFDLLDVCAKVPKMLENLNKLVGEHDWFKKALFEHYGAEKIAKAIDLAEKPEFLKFDNSKPKKFTRITKPKVTVIRTSVVKFISGPLADKLDFDPKDKALLSKGENVYRDQRPDDEVTNIVDWSPFGEATDVHNPNPGVHICEVVMDSGKIERCLVATALFAPESEVGTHSGKALVIRLSDKANLQCAYRDVWTKKQEEYPALKEYFDGLGTAGKPSSLPDRFVLVAPNFEVSCVMTKGWSDGEGSVSADVYCEPCTNHPDSHWGYGNKDRATPISTKANTRIVFTGGKSDTFAVSNNCLYYPEGTKVIPLPRKDLFLSDYPSLLGPKPEIFTSEKIQLKSAGAVTYISDTITGKTHEAYGKDAEADLVEKWGLREDQAKKAIEKLAKDKVVTIAVKFAAGVQSLLREGPTAPNVTGMLNDMTYPDGAVSQVMPIQPNSEGAFTIDSLTTPPGNNDYYQTYPQDHGTAGLPGIQTRGYDGPTGPEQDSELMQVLQQASQSGRKDLFDSTALLTLLKYTPIDIVIDRTMMALRKTINELGKMIAHIQWNRDEHAERFGKSEIGPILDRLRDLFVNSGEAFLVFKAKNIDFASEGIIPNESPTDEGLTN